MIAIERIIKICKNIERWMRENKAIFVAILLLMLCFGMMDNVTILINKTLIHITDIDQSLWLDLFFILITLSICVGVGISWIWKGKIIAPRTVAIIVVPLVLYGYFRICENSPFVFTSYWNGPISYLDGIAVVILTIIGLYIYQQFRKTGEKDNDALYSFDTDAPIKEADKDMFNMDNLVKRIVNYIAYTDVNDAAFSMGLVGEWGDGKTSLMNFVEEKIRKDHKNFIIVRFNPRSSKKADYIQEDFLDAIKQSLSPFHSGIDRTIDKYAVALDVIPDVPMIVSKGLELLQVRNNKKREVKHGELLKAIRDINRRIVVLVDDLDRLTGDELLEVMKVLDTNGAFPNMVFLTSFDKEYVNTVLNNYLGLGNQDRAYTDKYFTVEIRVPLHPAFRLMDYLVGKLSEACKSGFIKMNVQSIEVQTRNLSSFIMNRLHTIRDIKRFTNQFLYNFAEVQRDVNYRDFFLLELLKFAHPEDYEALYRMKYIHRGKNSILSPSSDELIYLNENLLPHKNKTGDELEEPGIKPESMDILRDLFPEEKNYENWYKGRYQRIYSASSFEHYFYNYEYSHLKADDIDRLFREENIADVCKMIDGWGDFSKDLETYLLTRDVNSIKKKNVLRRFMQILLYAAHKHQSINYIGYNYTFLRKEDVTKILENCGFSSMEEYITWFKESMEELTALDPLIPSDYLRTPISATYSERTDPDLFIMTQQEMHDYALELLKDYLGKIDIEGWNADNAYYMAQIQGDEHGGYLPAASKALHDSIVSHFGKYSSSLPFFSEDYERGYAGYNIKLMFKSVFENMDEFESLINAGENQNDAEIDMIRAIWPLFKANNYSNFALPKGVKLKDAKKLYLKPALEELAKYDKINIQIDELANDWKKRNQKDDVDAFVRRAMNLIKELRLLPLHIKKAEIFEIELQDMINQFQKEKQVID